MTTVRDLLKDDDKRTVSRTAFGLGVGAGLGFVVGGPVGAGIGALTGGALGALSDPGPQKGEMSPAREHLFWKAMGSCNPDGIEKAAAILAEAECYEESDALIKRAAVLRLPADESERRQATLLRVLCSGKIPGVEKHLSFFRSQGHVVAADAIAAHLADLHALAGGKTDAAMVERFEKRLALARAHGAPEESVTSAELLLSRARGVTPAEPEPAPTGPAEPAPATPTPLAP